MGAWRGPNDAIVFGEKTYGLRVHEFRKVLTLPERTGARFQVALDIHPDETSDIAALREHGWNLVRPDAAAGSVQRYQRFIAESRGELMVAKQLYVLTRGGWFSDRSACYLAAGRPVVAQDTGLAGLLPIGAGLLLFTSVDEAADAITQIERDHARHAVAAREVAACFEATAVLRQLLARLDLPSS